MKNTPSWRRLISRSGVILLSVRNIIFASNLFARMALIILLPLMSDNVSSNINKVNKLKDEVDTIKSESNADIERLQNNQNNEIDDLTDKKESLNKKLEEIQNACESEVEVVREELHKEYFYLLIGL